MAVSNVTVKQKYAGDGATASFPIPFVFVPGEVGVINVAMFDAATKEAIAPLPAYTLTPPGDTPTDVTFGVAPTAGEVVIVYREMPLTQVVDYIQNGSFLAESHERGLDRLALMIQDLADKGARSLRINMFDEGTFDVEFPPAVPGGVFGMNEAGDGLKVWANGEFIGPAGEINGVQVDAELEYNDPAPMQVVNHGSDTNAVLGFTLRKGSAATIAVGNVTGVGPDDPATVTNTGDSSNAVFDFEIPKGDKGESTVLITTGPDLPDDGIGSDGDLWMTFDILKPENGNVYQMETGTYVLKGNILGPPGGVEDIDGEVGNIAFDFSGQFSAHYNKTITATTLRAALIELYQIQYTAPQVSLSASGSSTLRERGTVVNSSNLTAAITKKSDPISEVRFYIGGVLLDTQNAGGGIPNGGNSTYAWSGAGFSTNTTFKVEVDDDGTSGGPSTVSATATFSFVYPYYAGAGMPGLTAAQVAGLTKRIINSTATRAETMTAGAGNVFYFAYPASYGALTSVLDENNFETFGDWTLRTENITGLDGNPVSYRIYEFQNPVTAGSYTYTFKR